MNSLSHVVYTFKKLYSLCFLNSGLNISTKINIATIATIIHTREKINIVHVSINVFGSLIFASRLSALKSKIGVAVSFDSILKNHLYAGNNNS